jgi:hypothetical protein
MGTAAGVFGFIRVAAQDPGGQPSLRGVAFAALLFLPGLVAAGAFLALAFSRNQKWIGRLYAADLVAAALACIAAIAALRTLEGPAAVVLVAGIAAVGTAVIAPAGVMRWIGLALSAGSLALILGNVSSEGRLLRLRVAGAEPLVERWNEHSRVRVLDEGGGSRSIVIDRSATTFMRHIPPPAEPDATWGSGAQYKAYLVGRPMRSVAIIGAGGGSDLLPAIYYGATRVDGYELNQLIIDFLQRDFRDYNALAARPEVRLIHNEARVGISRSGQDYDLIQASLIDTWAATASGGFVLSENALYTREGWRVFLQHLTPAGILTMTRWHLPDAPAETQRLVALAATSLQDGGFQEAASHIVLLRSDRNDNPNAFSGGEIRSVSTILVSKTPFSAEEVERLTSDANATGGEVMAAPGIRPRDSVLEQLLSSSTRGDAISASPFNIVPPTDLQPYFFLQVRPSDLLNLKGRNFGDVTQITFNGVRVLMVLAFCSISLVALVAVLTALTLPGSAVSAPARRVYRWMTLYFVGIGLGYILVQIGLLQRLSIVLGRPTFALSVVLFFMLLGTGFGAMVSEKIFAQGSPRQGLLTILTVLIVLRLGFSAAPLLERVNSTAILIGIVGLILSSVGFVLGCAFPLGVRRVAPTGEWAIAKMWAINGAASIAASVLAALIGLAWGSGAVLTGGIVAYALALAGSLRADM